MSWFNAAASVIGGVLGFAGQQKANNQNAAIANAQMAFQQGSQAEAQRYNTEQREAQEHFQRESIARQEGFQREQFTSAKDYATDMSNTVYQRGMADMRAAGLNPILAYQQGGATAPNVGPPGGAGGSGASASVGAQSGASARMESEMAPAVANAMQGARFLTELEQLAANVQRTKADTEVLEATKKRITANTSRELASTISEKERGELARQQQRWEPPLRGAQTAASSGSSAASFADADRTQLYNQDYRAYGPPNPTRDRAISAGRTIGSATTPGSEANNFLRRGGETVSEGLQNGNSLPQLLYRYHRYFLDRALQQIR